MEERRGGTEDLPKDDLVRELVAVSRARGGREMARAVSRLREWMDGREEGDALDRAVAEWLKAVVADLDPALGHELTAATTMKEVMEVIKPKGKWAVRWYEDGFDEGRTQLVRRLVARRFGADIPDRMVPLLDDFADPERIESVADAILDCETAEEFLARTADS